MTTNQPDRQTEANQCCCQEGANIKCTAQKDPQVQNEEEKTVEQPTNSNDLESCLVERDAWKERFLRVNADWENYKKRVEKERAQTMHASQAALLTDLLAIVDDFDRALAEHHERTPELDAWLKGFAMIHASFLKLLESYGVKEMAHYAEFDPMYHEALTQVDTSDYESGAIVDVMQKGYMFKDQVLRPAKVSVAK